MAITNINSGIRVKLPNIEALKLDPDTITDVLTVGARATSNYLKKFYREKDSKEPNKLGGRRTHFWNRQIGGNVQMPVTEGGKVIVGIDSAILPHKVKGGTIKAKRVKYLTIPMIAEAYAKPARSFDDLVFAQNKKGTKMLGKVEKTGSAARKFNPKSAAKKKQPKTKVPQKKQKPLGLRVERSAASQIEEKKSNFKMYYLLKEQVTQKPWPNSIPTEEQIAEVSIKAMDKRINRLVERSLK